MHPYLRDHRLVVDAPAIEHELADAGVIGKRGGQAAATGVAAVALVGLTHR